jgi:YjbE family integral membrane protein
LSLEFASAPSFWSALLQIVSIDLLLGGDNAVVIALASRRLAAAQRRQAIIWGTLAAVTLRVLLVVFALRLLATPGLRLGSAVLLLWIGARLMAQAGPDEHAVAPARNLRDAIRIVVLADLVMSLDNVIAIAGAAQAAGAASAPLLVVLGLLLSVPLVVWGSRLLGWLMQRQPWLVTLGAMLLGWIAGELAASDALLPTAWVARPAWPVAGAAIVWGVGRRLRARAAERR